MQDEAIADILRFQCSRQPNLSLYLCFYDYNKQTVLMINSATTFKDTVWRKLQPYFDKYKGTDGQIPTSKVQSFFKDILGEISKDERDYVMNNLFRLDVDSNGSVSFQELGNFLFTSHCSEMSLQRLHKQGKITYGAQKKMTLPEFIFLINKAYSFLNVSITNELGRILFQSLDSDKDNLITYAQYFKVIHVYSCRDKNQPVAKVDNSKQMHSKLRKYIWRHLKRLYDGYLVRKKMPTNNDELRSMITAIAGDLSQSEIQFLLGGLLQLQSLSFQAFAPKFIIDMAELGRRNFTKNHIEAKTTLNRDEFVRLLKTSYSFLKLNKFKDSILYKIFQKIDENHDGLITYTEYMDWVIRFLSCSMYQGDLYYTSEDDLDLDATDGCEIQETYDYFANKLVFSDYTFAQKVRDRVRDIIEPFMRNPNQILRQTDIENMLINITREDLEALKYTVANVYRQDMRSMGVTTMSDMINFFIELYYGELSIQNLHKTGYYKEGMARKMNRTEFKYTLQVFCEYIKLKTDENLFNTFFEELDMDKDGWVRYKEYFLFMSLYFGGASISALDITRTSQKKMRYSMDQYYYNKLRKLTPTQRVKSLVMNQLKEMFAFYDFKHNEHLDPTQMRLFFGKIFHLNKVETDILYRRFFISKSERGTFENLEDMVSEVLSGHFDQYLQHKTVYNPEHNDMINFQQFAGFLSKACRFVRIKPSTQDCAFLFKDLDENKNGTISYDQFEGFLRNNFIPKKGNGSEKMIQSKSTVSSFSTHDENQFIGQLWDTLKRSFDQIDKTKKGTLSLRQTEQFTSMILKEFSQRQKNCILSHFSTIVPHHEIDFNHLASEILKFVGESSLLKFHESQMDSCKNTLTDVQFNLVMRNAFNCMLQMQKFTPTIQKISRRLTKDNQIGYGTYLTWVHESLTSRR